MGGKRKNMSNAKRKKLTGGGPVGKTAVAGVKDRASNQRAAKVVTTPDMEILRGFVKEHTAKGATVYTDAAKAYETLPFAHEAVEHSVKEYVRGRAHTNGMESFRSMLKRAHEGTFHKISAKHLNRYVTEFAGKHNVRDSGTPAQTPALVAGLVGKRLMYRGLIADTGLSSGARS